MEPGLTTKHWSNSQKTGSKALETSTRKNMKKDIYSLKGVENVHVIQTPTASLSQLGINTCMKITSSVRAL